MTEVQGEYKVPAVVEGLILIIRGQKVILDSDLARVYGVLTKRLNEQVRRNKARFPQDFSFQLTTQELSYLKTRIEPLRSQFATLKSGRGKHRKFLPWAFTEHGALMAANVLNSKQAVRMSVFVVRAFVRLREALAVHKDLARKLEALEKKVGSQDAKIQAVFDALRELMKVPEKPKHRIGYLEEPRAIYRVR